MREWQGISGTVLKWIAVVTMFIDHFGAVVVARILNQRGIPGMLGTTDAAVLRVWLGTEENYRLYVTYRVLRVIGRFAFPVFAYMLVEGFAHTRDVRKYAARIGIFALVSEIPFDLALNGKLLEFGYQNIFFTLFLALLAMIVLERKERKGIWKAFFILIVTAAAMGLAMFLRTDYGGAGVACILILYLSRRNKNAQLVWGYAAFLILLGEAEALPAFLLLALYRGKRGAGAKYFFYCFYPAHLLVLYLLCVLMGIAVYPAL